MAKNNTKSTKTLAICLVSIFSVIFLLSTFNIIANVKYFLLGTFGLVIYPVSIIAILYGVALLTKRKFTLSIKYLLYLSFALFCLIAITHTIITGTFTLDNYGTYLKECYLYRYTAGGIIMGIFTFPLMSLLNVVASCVFFAIAFAIFVALIIDYLYAVKQYAKLNTTIIPNISKINKKSDSEVKSGEFDIVSEPNVITQDNTKTSNQITQNPENLEAKKKLFPEKYEDFQDVIIPSKKKTELTAAEKLFGEQEKTRNEWLNKNISTREVIKQKPAEEEKKDELRNFLVNSGIYKQPNNQPQTPQQNNIIQSNNTISSETVSTNLTNKPAYVEEDVLLKDIKPIQSKPIEEKIEQKQVPIAQKPSNIIMDKEVRLQQEHKIDTSLNNTVNIATPKPTYQQTQMIGTEKIKPNQPIVKPKPTKYLKPPIDILKKIEVDYQEFEEDQAAKSEIIEQTLEEFKIPAKVQAVRRGAAVTRYELKMPQGIPVKKIHNHCEDLELALATKGSIRIETPIRGKSAVGIEVPNDKIDTVTIRDVIDSKEFMYNESPLTFALGKDVDGKIFTCNLVKMPHLLVAGSTGSGKSVCLNALLISLIYRNSPEDLKLILIDPKRVEFTMYNDLPHLIMPKVITDSQKAINAFDWLINEMERRYGILQDNFVNNISNYNILPGVLEGTLPKLPYIVMVVDELADLMATGNKKELENKIVRLVQKARAAGIHLVLATQRPSVDVITGTIKTNLPSRIAFAVTNFIDSKTILDQGGAEKLLGRGDMLYSPMDSEPIRVQGVFVSNDEIGAVVEFIKQNNTATYDETIQNAINKDNNNNNGVGGNGAGGVPEMDPILPECLKLVIETGQATISMLQRRFSLGFSRAARIIDQMELNKYISPSEGGKPRNVYITMEEYNQIFGGGDN